MTEFYETRMGRTYFEHTVPELVRQLERLNENMERITTIKGDPDDHDDDEEAEPQDPRADRR